MANNHEKSYLQLYYNKWLCACVEWDLVVKQFEYERLRLKKII